MQEARTQLEEVTRLAPPALRAAYFLGRIALLQSDPEQAIRWLTQPAEGNPPVEDAPAQLGKAYFDAHRYSEARTWTEHALQLTPWDGNLHYRLARLHQQLGEREAAEKEFRASVELKTADREAVQALLTASQEIASGNVTAARSVRDAFLQDPKLDPDVLVALGSEFATAGSAEDAITLFAEAVRRDPTLVQAQFDLGLAFLKNGHPGEGVEPLKASVSIAPHSVDSNSALGLAYVLLGRFAEALPELELVYSVQPQNPKTTGLLALAYHRTGAERKAITILKDSLAKQCDNPKLSFLLIECLNNDEKQTEALEVAAEAVRHFPSLAKAHLAKGQQLARLGRYQEADPCFEKAAELAPNEIEPLLGLGETRNKAGHYEASLTSYQRVLDLRPNEVTAVLGSAKDLMMLHKISEAKALLERAAEDNRKNAQIHFELSRIYARLGAQGDAARETAIVEQLKSTALRDGRPE